MARLEGKLDGKTIIGVLDTGATSSAVTRSFMTMLQDEGHLVSIQNMSEPFKYKLAHDVLDSNGTATGETESEDFDITERCRLSAEWTLLHGPLCLRNTNFLIMEASMQELIVGLPELKKMGLVPVRIIDEVRENFQKLGKQHLRRLGSSTMIVTEHHRRGISNCVKYIHLDNDGH
jgi:hypothetical protein